MSFGPLGITATTANTAINSNPNISAAITAPNYLGNDSGAPNAVFTFSQPIFAFGLYMIDAGTVANGQISVLFENTANASFNQLVSLNNTLSNLNNTVLYFGFIDQAKPFNRVTVVKNNLNDFVAFDNITISAVPEPSALVSAALGLAALAGYGGRRRKRSAS